VDKMASGIVGVVSGSAGFMNF